MSSAIQEGQRQRIQTVYQTNTWLCFKCLGFAYSTWKKVDRQCNYRGTQTNTSPVTSVVLPVLTGCYMTWIGCHTPSCHIKNFVFISVVTVAGICNLVGGSVFWHATAVPGTAGAGDGGEYQFVSRLALLIGIGKMDAAASRSFWLSWNALIAHCMRQ